MLRSLSNSVGDSIQLRYIFLLSLVASVPTLTSPPLFDDSWIHLFREAWMGCFPHHHFLNDVQHMRNVAVRLGISRVHFYKDRVQ